MVISTFGFGWLSTASAVTETLTGTAPLTMEGDLAAKMVEGLSRFVLRSLADSVETRQKLWQRDYNSHQAYVESVAPNRGHFKRYIGCVDERLPVDALHYFATTERPAQFFRTSQYTVSAVRWPVFDGVEGEGLLLEPNALAVAQVIAIPDADWTPEMLVGLADGIPPQSQFARLLAECGCRVVVPLLIDRSDTWSGNPKLGRMTNQPHREFIYRMAFELGRHIIGYEVQKVLALVDWMTQARLPIGIIGYGEGGLLALYSAAVDTRSDASLVSGYFQSRQEVWCEPLYRNVWGLLCEFGDAEIASLIAPRPLIIEASRGPEVDGPPPGREGRSGAAPGQLTPTPPDQQIRAEFERARLFYEQLGVEQHFTRVAPDDGLPGSVSALNHFLKALNVERSVEVTELPPPKPPIPTLPFSPEERLRRQFHQLVAFTQQLLREAPSRRREFWSRADKTSIGRWQETCQSYRSYFRDEVIGHCPPPSVPANPRTRVLYDEPCWAGYEVVLDVWEDVFAYGILLLPKDLKPGEHRPVVVCQHGLEGRPQDVADRRIESVYHAYGAQLAERGFVVYAPQNPYIGGNTFRQLQRQANPMKWTLFSFIVRQHERLLEWLSEQPFVDAKRIGFYGLSYGGVTAMRVPALLDGYALSICSANYNDWVTKVATFDSPYSYVFTSEYEMPEFDLGNTFNYAEMAGLIAPRPFMVERGHQDGVAPDEWVAAEYATVRRLYVNLGIPERTSIEYFDGGHEIHSQGTLHFLHKYLGWPETRT